MFYLASRVVRRLVLVTSIAHRHDSSLDWQPADFDWSHTTELSLLLPWGLHYLSSLPASSTLWRRKKSRLEGLLAAQRALTQAGTPTRRRGPAVGRDLRLSPDRSAWLFVESRHGCRPITESRSLTVNRGSEKFALYPLQVLQPSVQLASSFDGTLGPRCTLGVRNSGQNLPFWYQALPVGLISRSPPARGSP